MGKLIDFRSVKNLKLLEGADEDLKEIKKNIHDGLEKYSHINYSDLSKNGREHYKENVGLLLLLNIFFHPCVVNIVKNEVEEKGRRLTEDEMMILINEMLFE